MERKNVMTAIIAMIDCSRHDIEKVVDAYHDHARRSGITTKEKIVDSLSEKTGIEPQKVNAIIESYHKLLLATAK